MLLLTVFESSRASHLGPMLGIDADYSVTSFDDLDSAEFVEEHLGAQVELEEIRREIGPRSDPRAAQFPDAAFGRD